MLACWLADWSLRRAPHTRTRPQLQYAVDAYASASGAAPTPGIGNAYASLFSANNGASWAASLPFLSLQLRGVKVSCAPTLSATPTTSQRATPSASATASETASSTPTLTLTSSATASQTASPSQSPSASQTASATGFPLQAVVDNTNALRASLVPAAGGGRVLSPGSWHAVSLQWPESDAACGPGAYLLVDASVALSLNASLPGGTASLIAQLYAADPTTGLPAGPALVAGGAFPVVAATPAYATFALTGGVWAVDAAARSRYAFVIYAQVWPLGRWRSGKRAAWLSCV